MHENVPNLDIILVQCVASMTVNNQLFASLTQEKYALIQNASWITGHSKQFRQHKVKAFKRVKQTSQDDHVTYPNKLMKSLVMGMSTASLQASEVAASLFSNQVPDGVLGKIVPIHVPCKTASCSSSVHNSLVSLKQAIIDCHGRNTLEQYYVQLWYIFMLKILFGDVFKSYKFLFWLSV